MIARVLVIIASLASLAGGQVTIDLPLKGYYRLGQYMPIHVSVAGSPRTVEIEGDGFVKLHIDNGPGGSIGQTFPLLVLSTPSRTITVTIDGKKQSIELPFPLRERGDDERLIACIGNIPDAFAANHFVGKRIVRVDLQPPTITKGPIEAWESLDAMFIDPLPKELNNQPDTFSRLASQGVLVAIRSDTPLNERWRWKRDGELWSIQHEPVGPTTSLLPAAHAPVTNWSAAYVAHDVRRQVIGDAVIVAILTIGATLLRPTRKALAAVAGLTIAAMLLMALWTANIETHKEVRGAITIRVGGLTQTDNWEYHTVTEPDIAEWAMDQSSIARPMLEDAEAARRIDLRTMCHVSADSVTYSMNLTPETKIAFMSRQINPAVTDRQPRTDQTPMHALVRDAYPRCRIVGDTPASEDEDSLGSVDLVRD